MGGGKGQSVACHYKIPRPCHTIKTVNRYRTIDGSCNNLKHPIYGMAFTPLARALPAEYDDGISSPRSTSVYGGKLPSPRAITVKVHTDAQAPDHVATVLVMSWGQFLDHDISHTALSKFKNEETDETENIVCGDDGCDSTVDECLPIPIDPTDKAYQFKKCLEFVRSAGVSNRDCKLGPRQHLNQITHYLDSSNIYGSSEKTGSTLRVTKHGKGKGIGKGVLGAELQTTPHPFEPKLKDLLPRLVGDSCIDTDKEVRCFHAGDARTNEQSYLTVIHTIWVREHNRIVQHLRKRNPDASEENLYQEARRIVGAMNQHIHYNEYLRLTIGEQHLDTFGLRLLDKGFYTGYNASLDVSTTNVFATAAFRWAHSMVPTLIKRVNSKLNPHAYRILHMSQTFFRPRHIYNSTEGGVDAFLRSLYLQSSERGDRFFSSQVTWGLFNDKPPYGHGTDLPAINVNRGRDHGLPNYNKWRVWCDLEPVSNFAELGRVLKNPWLAKLYESLYKHIDDLDLFTAAVSEPHVPGSTIGETLLCIIGREFRKFREADRFWYENKVPGTRHFTEGQLETLREVTLAKVICNNGDYIDRIQKFVMKKPSKSNPFTSCGSLPDLDFSQWDNIEDEDDKKGSSRDSSRKQKNSHSKSRKGKSRQKYSH